MTSFGKDWKKDYHENIFIMGIIARGTDMFLMKNDSVQGSGLVRFLPWIKIQFASYI